MFTCKKIRNGSTYLDTHLSANDYYCEQEQVTGVWVGKGAERLGIAGQTVEKEDVAFEALRLNQHPDGSGPLTPRKAENSIRFFDFQCSAQKSVSLMAVMMEDRRLYDAHDRATRKALGLRPSRPGRDITNIATLQATSVQQPSATTPRANSIPNSIRIS
jgi:conjugative relaxase-like TrwC/TraI family protein